MKCFLPNGFSSTVLLFLATVCFPAFTEGHHVIDDSLSLPHGTSNESESLSETIRRVQRSTGGLILGAERVSYDGKSIDRVKYMDGNGHVRYMDAPATQHPEGLPAAQPLSSPRHRDHH